MDIKLIIIYLLVSYHGIDCQNLTQSKQLMADKLTGYDKRQRPVLDQSQPVYVNVSFDLVAIQDFDEVKELFSVVGVVYLSWIDESIVWNRTKYGGIWSQMYKIDDVWYPILIQANPYNSVKDIGDDWMSVRILYNGLAYFSPGAVFKSTCSVDVTYYPFDKQTCELLFIPWGFLSEEMKLISTRSDVMQNYYSPNGEWVLESSKAYHDTGGGFDSITFSFTIRRKPLFLVINVILPIIFMAVINLLVFVLPVESGERVSYAITVLLSIAVFLTLVGDNMPKTSEPMSILCYFLMLVLVISTLMCVVTIFNLKVFHKHGKVPRCFVAITRCLIKKKHCCCTRKRKVGPQNAVEKIENAVTYNGYDKDVMRRIEKFDAFEHVDSVEEDTEITWKDVSLAIDRLSLVGFSVTLAVVVAVYMYILISNKTPTD